jgi:hypothetical protein
MKEKLRQVRSAIYVPKRDRQTRLDAVAGTDNPYSLIALFSRGHLAIKAGGGCLCYKMFPRQSSAQIT